MDRPEKRRMSVVETRGARWGLGHLRLGRGGKVRGRRRLRRVGAFGMTWYTLEDRLKKMILLTRWADERVFAGQVLVYWLRWWSAGAGRQQPAKPNGQAHCAQLALSVLS